MRDYGKVYSTFWSSETTGKLSQDAQILALYLMTCTHGTIAGVFRLPDGYVTEDLGPAWTAERVAAIFLELSGAGFACRCATSKWVWIVKHLEWNRPENPNQRKACAKVASSVPDLCAWRDEFVRRCGTVVGLDSPPTPESLPPVPTAPEGFGNGSETVVELFANQKQEQEQKQEQDQKQEKPSASSAARLPPCPHRKLLDLYAEHLPMLPQPKPEIWGGQRAKHLASRWKWLLAATKRNGERYASTEEQGLDWFRRFFAYVAESEFLTGRSGKFTSCDLGWLVNEENFAKVIQGNYDNREAA